MERLLQYLDEVDDLIGVIALCAERIRNVAYFVASAILFLAAVLGGIALALSSPALALAIVSLLTILLLYRRFAGSSLRYAS